MRKGTPDHGKKGLQHFLVVLLLLARFPTAVLAEGECPLSIYTGASGDTPAVPGTLSEDGKRFASGDYYWVPQYGMLILNVASSPFRISGSGECLISVIGEGTCVITLDEVDIYAISSYYLNNELVINTAAGTENTISMGIKASSLVFGGTGTLNTNSVKSYGNIVLNSGTLNVLGIEEDESCILIAKDAACTVNGGTLVARHSEMYPICMIDGDGWTLLEPIAPTVPDSATIWVSTNADGTGEVELQETDLASYRAVKVGLPDDLEIGKKYENTKKDAPVSWVSLVMAGKQLYLAQYYAADGEEYLFLFPVSTKIVAGSPVLTYDMNNMTCLKATAAKTFALIPTAHAGEMPDGIPEGPAFYEAFTKTITFGTGEDAQSFVLSEEDAELLYLDESGKKLDENPTKAGKYTLTVLAGGKQFDFTFHIVATNDSPKTGDAKFLLICGVLATLSLAGAGFLLIRDKRQEEN